MQIFVLRLRMGMGKTRERAAADDRPVTRADTGKSRHLAHSPFRPKIFSHIIMIVTNRAFSNYFRKIAVVRKHNKRRTDGKKPQTRMALSFLFFVRL